MSERLRVLFAVELDRDRLEAYRDELLEREEPLYTEERFPQGTITVKHWPGEPHEWTSLTDVVDLMAPDVGAITRTELLYVDEGPPPSVSLAAGAPSRWRRWFRWLPFLAAVLAALSVSSPAEAASVSCVQLEPCVGTSSSDTITGTSIADAIRGRAGADTIRGRRGDDGIRGGGGADTIIAGRGHDFVRAGGGADVIDTSDGVFDLIDSCGDGIDTVIRDLVDFVAPDCELEPEPDPAP